MMSKNSLSGYPVPDLACDICKKITKDNELEPRFGYVSCPEHANIPPAERHKHKEV